MAPEAIAIPDPQQRARTTNEAAGMVFPEVAKHFQAFFEREDPSFNGPPRLDILELNDEFWALTLGPHGSPKHPIVYVPAENQFRRYNPSKGIFEPASDSAVIGGIMGNLDLSTSYMPLITNAGSFLALKNRQRLKTVMERAKDLLAVDDDYFQDRQHLHLSFSNGVLQIDNNQFHASDPARPVKETLPVKYDPAAECNIFLKMFLANILSPEDIDLLQRYLSQILEGINHSQSILILTGDAGWGKSSLMKILGTLVGWGRVGIIREQLFHNEFELAHYAGKNLLFHPDMPTDFLNRKEASIFKQLVGGDPLWADVKADDGRIVLEGNFPVILACNGKPKIHIDEDADAWLRRLVVLSFKTPGHEQHYGKMAELILKNESSGILNWLLEGRAKLVKDKLQLTQTPDQKGRSVNLLLGSDSPAAFVRSALVKKKDSELGVVELFERYQIWCRENNVRPFASRPFTFEAKEEIEIGLGLKYRHDLASDNGKTKRGWKGLAILERTVAERLENKSNRSAA
jgi:P4 family phage/plasmid primase-like protien